MRKLIFAAAAAVTLLGVAPAPAADYPSRPITLVVPLSVGGSTDVIGRIIAQGMGEALGQTIVVETPPAPAAPSAKAAFRARRPTATPSASANGAPMSRPARSTSCLTT